jgi:Type II secretory pathway, prepilin signal peptidase PulO and related peptidases
MQATIPLVSDTSSSLLSGLLPGHVETGLGLAFGSLPGSLQIAFTVVFGLVIGSFLNVVVHRVPIMLERAWREEVSEATEQPLENDGLPARYNLWAPRSACPHCGHVLSAWENLPVLSYLLLRGRCSACKTHVSLRYPLLEIASAAFAAGALALYGPTGMALAAFGLCAALLAMSAIDIDTHLLPDSMTLPLCGPAYRQLQWHVRESPRCRAGRDLRLSGAVGRALVVPAGARRRRYGLW